MARIDFYTHKKLADFLAENVEPGIIYESPGMVHFRCPCGCGVQYDLPVNWDCQVPASRDWRFSVADGKPTLTPSIFNRAPGQCDSHFFVRDGRVEWC